MYGKLKNKNIAPRLLDERLAEDLEVFGAVCLQGPKYCGKTWTGRSFANSEISIMDPEDGFQNRQTAELAPNLVLMGEPPRLIDEWQEVPALWDAGERPPAFLAVLEGLGDYAITRKDGVHIVPLRTLGA